MESEYNLDVFSLYTPGPQSFASPGLDEVGPQDTSIPMSPDLMTDCLA